MESKRITDEEIQSLGWTPQVIRIDKEALDDTTEHDIVAMEDDDVLIDGWSITKDDKTWWEMCRNSRRLLIVKKWYNNEVSQSWDIVMDVIINDSAELYNEMNYLKIPIENGKSME